MRQGTTRERDMSYILIQSHSWMIDSATGISVEIDLKGNTAPVGSIAEKLPQGGCLDRLS